MFERIGTGRSGSGSRVKNVSITVFYKKIENDFELSILISREGGSGLTVEFSYSTKYPIVP